MADPRVLRLSPLLDWRAVDPPCDPEAPDAIGGMAAQVLRQTAGLAALGVPQTVLAYPAAGAPVAGAVGTARIRSVGRRDVPGVHRRNLAWLLATIGSLRSEGARHDVVHVHASGIVEPLLAAVAARLVTRRPLVLTLHCSAQATYVARSRKDALVQVVTRAAERLAIRLATRTLTLTDRVRTALDGDRIEALPDCLDAGAFAAAAAGRDAFAERHGVPPGTVAYLGRVSAEKGWPALVHLAEGGRDVLVCGDGPDLPALRAEVDRRGLQDRFAFAPAVASTDVPAAIASAAVLVLPSEHEELGSVLLEAAAVGVPTVAYDVGGTSEAIVDGVTGLLVPAGDLAALAAAVDRARTDPVLRESARREGPARVRERYDVAVIAGRLREVYREAVR